MQFGIYQKHSLKSMLQYRIGKHSSRRRLLLTCAQRLCAAALAMAFVAATSIVPAAPAPKIGPIHNLGVSSRIFTPTGYSLVAIPRCDTHLHFARRIRPEKHRRPNGRLRFEPLEHPPGAKSDGGR